MAVTKRKRAYRKAARAESEAETRDRIVEAVVALHEEVGPRRTTISAIAEKAGVQRLTVYRHFPGEPELIAACSTRWSERNPPPDFTSVRSADPEARTREMLTALYRYYRRCEAMLTHVMADAAHMPVVAQHIAPLYEYVGQLAEELDRAWPRRSARRSATLRHAVQFATWQSLSALTADDRAAADLATSWCLAFR